MFAPLFRSSVTTFTCPSLAARCRAFRPFCNNKMHWYNKLLRGKTTGKQYVDNETDDSWWNNTWWQLQFVLVSDKKSMQHSSAHKFQHARCRAFRPFCNNKMHWYNKLLRGKTTGKQYVDNETDDYWWNNTWWQLQFVLVSDKKSMQHSSAHKFQHVDFVNLHIWNSPIWQSTLPYVWLTTHICNPTYYKPCIKILKIT